jgi:hypothetical protein
MKIPRKLLWPAIKKMGIPQETLEGTKKKYAKNEAQLKIGNRISTDFRTMEGLKQGCGLSQTLFKIYLESVLYDILEVKKYGVASRERNNTSSSFCG